MAHDQNGRQLWDDDQGAIPKWLACRRKVQLISRVGHRVLFRSERIVLLRSFKERKVLLRSFFEFLATFETQKNDVFFCVLFLRT